MSVPDHRGRFSNFSLYRLEPVTNGFNKKLAERNSCERGAPLCLDEKFIGQFNRRPHIWHKYGIFHSAPRRRPEPLQSLALMNSLRYLAQAGNSPDFIPINHLQSVIAVRVKWLAMETNATHQIGWARVLSRFFGGPGLTESVHTTIRLRADPKTVWARLLTYEEVPGSPSFLLRTLLPVPIRTEGKKHEVGAPIHCFYQGGTLLKVVTASDPPHYFAFEVTRQSLGVESCVRALLGTYEIQPVPDGTQIVLTTHYRAHLRPRFFWRPIEAFLTHQMHRHILSGMRDVISHAPEKQPVKESLCTTSQSPSRP